MVQAHPVQMCSLVLMSKWAESIENVVQGVCSRIRNLRFLIPGFLVQFSIWQLL